MTVAIYELKDPKTGLRLYLGQSSDIEKRRGAHLGKLTRGNHGLRELQDYVHKYGQPVFHIVEECELADLNQLEVSHFEENEPMFWAQKPSLNYRYTGNSGDNNLEKTCATCKCSFTAQQSRALYCSRYCKYLSRKTLNKCDYCLKEFITFGESKMCSTQCRLDYKKVALDCPTCGVTFKSNGAKYCSSLCSPKVKTKQLCLSCGLQFESSRKRANYCSHKCRHQRLFNCVCRKCGRDFTARHANSKLCSRACGAVYDKHPVTI